MNSFALIGFIAIFSSYILILFSYNYFAYNIALSIKKKRVQEYLIKGLINYSAALHKKYNKPIIIRKVITPEFSAVINLDYINDNLIQTKIELYQNNKLVLNYNAP